MPKVTEKEFEKQVEQLAKLYGWLYYHTWRATHSVAGFPDLVLCRPPRTIYAELKTEKGTPSDAQKEWLDLLAKCPCNEVFLWKPSDWEEIVGVLKPVSLNINKDGGAE